MIDRDAEFGQYGGVAITTTAAATATATGYFYKLQFCTTAIVTAQTDYGSGFRCPALYSITAGFTAGTVVYGKWTSITLSAAGAMAIAYYGTKD